MTSKAITTGPKADVDERMERMERPSTIQQVAEIAQISEEPVPAPVASASVPRIVEQHSVPISADDSNLQAGPSVQVFVPASTPPAITPGKAVP
jgi:hypothetical protein